MLAVHSHFSPRVSNIAFVTSVPDALASSLILTHAFQKDHLPLLSIVGGIGAVRFVAIYLITSSSNYRKSGAPDHIPSDDGACLSALTFIDRKPPQYSRNTVCSATNFIKGVDRAVVYLGFHSMNETQACQAVRADLYVLFMYRASMSTRVQCFM
jgi:hypothetical protein